MMPSCWAAGVAQVVYGGSGDQNLKYESNALRNTSLFRSAQNRGAYKASYISQLTGPSTVSRNIGPALATYSTRTTASTSSPTAATFRALEMGRGMGLLPGEQALGLSCQFRNYDSQCGCAKVPVAFQQSLWLIHPVKRVHLEDVGMDCSGNMDSVRRL